MARRSVAPSRRRQRRPGTGVAARRAGLLDFTRAFVRRALRSRCRGRIDVRHTRSGVFTVVHRYVSAWDGRTVEMDIAQVRRRRTGLQLFWQPAPGRWVVYGRRTGRPFVAGLGACVDEIARDPHGCFWG